MKTISQKEWNELLNRISALEKREQERIDKENYIKEHSSEAVETARKLLLGN